MEITTPKKNWFSRNWKWVVPVGVLVSGLALVVCCVVGGAAAIYGGVNSILGILKSHPAFQDSLEMVQADARVQELLGTPIEAGSLVSGSISETPVDGTAELSYPVSGPKGSGTVYVSAKKVEGEWVLTRVVLKMDKTGERLVIVGAD